MKHIVILGAGTAGTMMANHLDRVIDGSRFDITIVDQYASHYYQPGFLFIPFDLYKEKDVVKNGKDFIPEKVNYIQEEIEQIKPAANQVLLKNGTKIGYDILIIATGCKIAPQEIAGLAGEGWHTNVFDFYTYEGACALRERLKTWQGGRLAVHIAEMPIKCPVAPLEFAFLADAFLTRKGVRPETTLTYVTPLAGAFTKQNCSVVLGHLLADKDISLVADFNIEKNDPQARQLVAYDGNKVDYDLLVSIPTNKGDELIARSGLGDDLNFVPTDKHTLQAKAHENIFVIGDATDLPSSKAGSVAHFQSEVLTVNVLRFIRGEPLRPDFDGHANCFIESGFGKAFLIDFNYDLEPVQGSFPLPLLGPFSLLKESRVNHLGKRAFKWIYWHLLLPGRSLPGISTRMSKIGKKIIK
jgi:sulfide:quinone oxidoreductase